MTTSELEQGNYLNSLINYYTTVKTTLEDPAAKVDAMVNFLSAGNTNVPADENTAWLNGIRDGLIASLLTDLNARITELGEDFEEL